MKLTLARLAFVAALIALAWRLVVGVPRAFADGDDDRFVYAVNAICQFSGGTTINVHNPNGRTITIIKKGIPLDVGQVPSSPHEQQQETLKPDWALLMGCDDIAALGAVGPGGSGDVIIESGRELDVWAVYTSIIAGGGIGETRGPIRVPPTKVKR